MATMTDEPDEAALRRYDALKQAERLIDEKKFTEALSILETVGEGADPEAAAMIGWVYAFSDYPGVDWEKARPYVEMAARAGLERVRCWQDDLETSTRARYDEWAKARRLVDEGRDTEALAILEAAYDGGDRRVAELIGWIYSAAGSKHAGRDPRKARPYLEVAAKARSGVGARYALGKLLLDAGEEEAGLRWLNQASDEGFGDASLALAQWYLRMKDRPRAVAYLVRAADEQKHPEAVQHLARFRMIGRLGMKAMPRGLVDYLRNIPNLVRYATRNKRMLGLD
jgi:TPR repeat protein